MTTIGADLLLAASLLVALLAATVQLSSAFVRRLAERAAPRRRLTALHDGAAAHWRVRVAMYTVLVASGVHAATQAWHADHRERQRLADAQLADMAGAQRMLSQRLARLSTLAAHASPDEPDYRDTLRAGLHDARERAEDLSRRVDELAADLGPDGAPLQVAAEQWHATRTRLWRRIAELLEAGPDLAPAVEKALHADAELALDAAQALVDAVRAAADSRHQEQVDRAKVWAAFTVLLMVTVAIVMAEPAARAVRRQYRRLATQSLALERLALVSELTSNLVIVTDETRRITWVNDAFARLTGHAPDEARGQEPVALLRGQRAASADTGAAETAAARLLRALEAGHGVRVTLAAQRRDGGELWLDLDVQPLHGQTGERAGFVMVGTDITERRRALADQRIAAIAFDAGDAVVITDARQVILKVNPAFTRITGYSEAEAVGQVTGRLLRSGRHDEAFYRGLWAVLQRDRHWQGEIWNRRKNGELYPEWLSITAVLDEDGQVANYVAVFADITQKKQADETIHQLAFYDPLTELPNRRLMRDRLGQALAHAARERRPLAVLFIDLDHFKALNDTRGHDVGDRLLQEVAHRLRACVRAADTVARLGGDEFVVILPDLSASPERAAAEAEMVAEKIRAALAQPYPVDEQGWHCTPSIGIALLAGEAADAEADELLKRADTAMYEAKRCGRNTIRFFDPATHAAMAERVALEADLRAALEREEFRLVYQVQVDVNGSAMGAEALLRWHHPRRGVVPPADFIPLAEDTDLIVPIGQWVLVSACRQLRRWAWSDAARELTLAVNVSARQFRQPDFVDRVRDALASTGADPSRLCLELTESVVLDDLVDTAAKMGALRDLGVSLSIDDFGTGQSSLAYLGRLPLDQLKIDRSFVANMLGRRTEAVIVQAIIGMARSLGLEVLAEGVETLEQRDALRAWGCGAAQGWLFGRPLPIEEFERRHAAGAGHAVAPPEPAATPPTPA
ncbi:EAL domain-containing protein [Ideonella sp.]|uniref:EAL domain-containing protein n=1 Tax=Ideonella sp. TaxID=1929293 RepID=UPI0035B4839C